jgi:pyruvate/2-oxoglutarate dehydrogenase complex dihydrolipoamide dehydrogenase (E3) component
MSQPEQFEVLVLGSGTAGKLIAWHMAGAGRRTAVVERKWVGGSCPNIACMPSKNEIWSAKAAHFVRHAAEFGMTTGPVVIDMAVVRERKRKMVEAQVAAHLRNYKESGAELIMGSARFLAPKTLEVTLNDGGTRLLSGDKVFINVGTHAAIPDVPGLTAAKPLTHIEALELNDLPRHLIVLGGGYVGLELAQAYRRFGRRVTIIEHGSQLMSREDRDVAEEIQRILSEERIDILLNTEVLRVSGRSGEEASLEEAGVELNERGYVRVNERLETSAPSVWALGECAGSPQFTHISEDDFRIVRDNLGGGKRSTHDRLVPYCMFTEPPLAHVGLSERDAERQGVKARVAKLPMSGVLRAQAIMEMRGFMKVLVDEADDRLVGFTMIGPEAGEVMAVMQTAMLAGLPYTRLRDAVLTHPTFAEGLGPLLAQVPASAAEQAAA